MICYFSGGFIVISLKCMGITGRLSILMYSDKFVPVRCHLIRNIHYWRMLIIMGIALSLCVGYACNSSPITGTLFMTLQTLLFVSPTYPKCFLLFMPSQMQDVILWRFSCFTSLCLFVSCPFLKVQFFIIMYIWAKINKVIDSLNVLL